MCTVYPEIFAALAAEFAGKQVRTRQAGNRQVLYITARTVMNRLDTVLGPENWRDEYTPLQNGVLCTLSVRLPDGEWISKSDAGGHAGMSDEGDDEKSGFSDAFKRAAVKWGVGRHLYGEGAPRYGGASDAPVGRSPADARRERQPGAETPAGGDRGGSPPAPSPSSPPETGREFWLWIKDKPRAVRDRAKALAASWGYPARCIDLNREEVQSMFNELTLKNHGGFGDADRNGDGGR